MASRPKNWYDKRAIQAEGDEPNTWEAQLAAERERNARLASATNDDLPEGQEGG